MQRRAQFTFSKMGRSVSDQLRKWVMQSSVGIYWARQSYERPKSGAIRLALAILVVLNLYMGVLLFSAVKLGFLSSCDAINNYAPYILPGSILGSVGVYLAAKESLNVSQSE